VTSELRAGIIGASPWAGRSHAPGLAAAGFRIAAIHSRSPGPAGRLAAEYGAKVAPTLDDLLAECDVVAIATPNSVHAPAAVVAAQAGKHLFIDKPLSTDLFGARAIAAAARTGGVRALVTLTYRASPAVAACRRLVADGAIGALWSVRGFYLSGRYGDPARPADWRTSREAAGGGSIGDLGPHLLDLVAHVTGLPIERIYARTRIHQAERPGGIVDNDDECALVATLASGVTASLLTQRDHPVWPNHLEIELTGSRGSLRLLPSGDGIPVTGALWRGETGGASAPVLFAPPYPDDFDADLAFATAHFGVLARRFRRAILTATDADPGLNAGLAVQTAIEAALRSAAEDRPVALDELR